MATNWLQHLSQCHREADRSGFCPSLEGCRHASVPAGGGAFEAAHPSFHQPEALDRIRTAFHQAELLSSAPLFFF